jgi:spore maturation protein CgeB
MKLLIHAHAYPDFLEGMYGTRPELASLDYCAQFAALDRESHIWANAAWAEALRPLGYDVMVTISNNEHIQKTWATEHGIRYSAGTWQTEIADAQVASFQPDLLFFTSHIELRPEWIKHLRAKYPEVGLFGVWCGMPFRSIDVFEHFDLVLTCVPELNERFRSFGCNSRHMHHAFDTRVLDHVDADGEQDIPFSFIGQLIRASDFHEERVRQLVRIAEAMEITIFSPAHDLDRSQQRRRPVRVVRHKLARMLTDMRVLRKSLDRLPLLRRVVRRAELSAAVVSEKLRPHTRPAVFGLAMYQTLQRSQVNYNCHIDIAAGSASNRRLFECTGVGSCLLTDHKANMSTLFEPDSEVVTFSSTEECIDKAKWLLDNPQERRKIAQAGQRRTLAEHTFTQRAGQFDAVIREVLARPGPARQPR